MENNNEKVRSKSKITVVVLTVLLLLGAIACVSVLLKPKENEVVKGPEEITVNGTEGTASDETTLRELLLKESELVIRVTEDILVDKPISVKGTKKLIGTGSISMELYVAPYQNLLVVEPGANLTLDGVTVDGNGSATCVKVEKGAKLTCQSGELTYGSPTIVETYGDVSIKGGSITNAIGTGLYIHNGANVHMVDGTIRGCADTGIEVADSGYLSISENATLQDNMGQFIYNRGTCDITGGVLRHAQDDMIYTSGIVNVKYQGEAGKRLEWQDIKGCAVVVGNGGEFNADGLNIRDIAKCALTTSAGKSVVNVKNSLFENATWDTIYVRTEVNLTNVEIKGSGKSGIMLIETGKANLDSVTISNTVKDGIQNAGGVVTGKNIVVNAAGRIGVNTYKANEVAGSSTLTNVTVNGTEKSNGLHVETSLLTASNVKIKNVGGEGARAQKAGTLNLTDVEIQDSKSHNIASYDAGSKVILKNVKTVGGTRGVAGFGGNVEATNVTIEGTKEFGVTGSKASVVNITGLTVRNSGRTGVNANAATINVNNATIENPKATAGVNADNGGKITLKNADVKFTAESTVKVDGVKAIGAGTVILEKVNITNAPWNGIYIQGAEAKLTATNVVVDKVGSDGVRADQGGKLQLTHVDIKNSADRSLFVQHANSKATVDTVKITGGKRGVQIWSGGTVEGKAVTVTSPETYGITCGDAGSGFNITGLTITGAGTTAMNVYGSASATATDGTISNPGSHGAYVSEGGALNLNRVSIQNPKECNLFVRDENSKAQVLAVTMKGGARGVQIWSKGTVAGSDVTITSPETYGITCGDEGSGFDIAGLTITDAGTTAMNVYGSAAGTITKGTITKPGANAGFVGSEGQLTLNHVTVSETGQTAFVNNNGTLNVKGGSLAQAGEHGVHTYKGGQTSLADWEVQNSANHNIRVDDANSKYVLSNVKATGGKRGIQIYSGGTVEGSDVTVISPETYGITCGDEGSGFNITGLTVTSCGTIAMNVYDSASGSVTNGTITNPGTRGGYVGNKGQLTLNHVAISESVQTALMNSNGTLNVTGGSVVGAGEDGVQTSGGGQTTLTDWEVQDSKNCNIRVDNANSKYVLKNVKATGGKRGIQIWSGGTVEGNTVTVTSPTEYGITCGDKGSGFNIAGLTVADCGNTALNVYSSAVATVTNGTITNPSRHGANVNGGASLNLSDVEVTFAEGRTGEINGVHVVSPATVTLEKVNIANAVQHGIYVEGASANVSATDTTVVKAGVDGVLVSKGGQISLTRTNIQNSKERSLFVQNANSKAKVDTVTLEGGKRGVQIYSGGAVEGNGVTVTSPTQYGITCGDNGSGFNITGLTVTNCGTTALNVYDSAVATVTSGTITNPGNNGAYVGNKASLTLNDVGVTFAASKTGNYDGVYAKASTANLQNVTVTGAPRHGVQLDGAGTKATLTGTLHIVSPKKRGLVNLGGTVDGSDGIVRVETPAEFGVATNVSGATGGKTTIKELYVTGAKGFSSMTVNGAGTVVTINGGKISGSVGHGVNASAGTLNLNNIEITGSGSGKVDVLAQNGSTINLKGVTYSSEKKEGTGTINK